MARGQKKQRSMALYEAILKLRDLDECCRFFDDLCTPTELRSMEKRFDVATYLLEDQVYLEILEKTGASSATISRVRRNILDKTKHTDLSKVKSVKDLYAVHRDFHDILLHCL